VVTVQTESWFEGALRPDVVVAHLRARVPDLVTGSLEITRCRVTRVRSVPPEGSWTATYEFDVDDRDGGAPHTVVARGVMTPDELPLPPALEDAAPFGSASWGCVLPDLRLALTVPPLDDALPGLTMLLDAERGPGLLTRALLGGGVLVEGTAVVACAPTVAAYKPGVRATVVCRLGLGADADAAGADDAAPADDFSGPEAVVVKVHSDDEGERGHEALRSLAQSPLAESPLVQVPRPLAHLPELRLSVQQHIEHECSLKDLFHAAFEGGGQSVLARLAEGSRGAGAALAALHRCGSGFGEGETWEQDLADVRRKHASLVSVVPELGGSVAEALVRIEAAAARTAADLPCPSHGSFHPAQVLVTAERLALIDFDKCCQAEPARDLAAFTTKLRHMAVNKVDTHRYDPGGAAEVMVETLRETFLGEYTRTAPLSERRLAVWEALEVFSLVLSASKKMLGPRTQNCVAMLQRHLDDHGL
jgi:Ser/Thr protein kinase RdoA (MazF antagonist)